MITTLEGIGASYRRKANTMLDEVEKILPQTGICHYARSARHRRLYVYIESCSNCIQKLMFIAHPSTGHIEIVACCSDESDANTRKYGKAIIRLKHIKDLRLAIQKAVSLILMEMAYNTKKHSENDNHDRCRVCSFKE